MSGVDCLRDRRDWEPTDGVFICLRHAKTGGIVEVPSDDHQTGRQAVEWEVLEFDQYGGKLLDGDLHGERRGRQGHCDVSV